MFGWLLKIEVQFTTLVFVIIYNSLQFNTVFHSLLGTEFLYHLEIFAFCVFILLHIFVGIELTVCGIFNLRDFFANYGLSLKYVCYVISGYIIVYFTI